MKTGDAEKAFKELRKIVGTDFDDVCPDEFVKEQRGKS